YSDAVVLNAERSTVRRTPTLTSLAASTLRDPSRLYGNCPRLASPPKTPGHDLRAPLVSLSDDRDELFEAFERSPLGFEHDVAREDGSGERAGVRDEHAGGVIVGSARPGGGGAARRGNCAPDEIGADMNAARAPPPRSTILVRRR